MITLVAIIATFCVILILPIRPHLAFLCVIAVKPIIDTTWKDQLFGFSLIDIISVIVPVVMLIHVLRSRHFRISNTPLANIGLVYLVWNFFISVGMLSIYGDIIGAAEYAFKSLNFFAGLFMIPFVVRDPASFRRLLIFMLIAGLFPMLMGIYQALTGTIWEIRTTAYGLQRNVGLYHDAFSFRAYGFQTLTAIILMWSYFTPRKFLWKVLLIAYVIVCGIVLFKVYSKAAVVISVVWLVVWSIFHSNRKGLVLAIMIGLITFLSDNMQFHSQLGMLFSKEFAVYQGTLDERFILSGRPTIWTKYWGQWQDFDGLTRIVGYWKNIPAHNDLLRVIYTAGIIGLFIYLMFLYKAGVMLLKRLFMKKTPLTIMGAMVFAMWIIDVTGLTPSIYPAYCWYVLGFITLAIRGVPGLEQPKIRHVSSSTISVPVKNS